MKRHRLYGFTLIELTVALVLVGILTALALPNFQTFMQTRRVVTETNEIVKGMYIARSEAVKRKATVTMCVSSNQTSCTGGAWHAGWIVLTGTEILRKRPAGDSGIEVATGVDTIAFGPSGVATLADPLQVCDGRGWSRVGRSIQIGGAGRPLATEVSC